MDDPPDLAAGARSVELERLAALHARGSLTDEEFQQAKQHVLRVDDPHDLAEGGSSIDLEQLADDHARGSLADEAFQRAKQRVLDVDDLYDLAAVASSREDFVRFLDALRADLRVELARPESEVAWGAGDWSHPDLEGFLETFGRFLTDGRRFDALDNYVWKAFAEMLLAARICE